MKSILTKIFFVFVFFMSVWWWTGDSRNETTIYPGFCTSHTPIRPFVHMIDIQNFEESYKRHKAIRSQCGVTAGDSKTYRLNTGRAEVYYYLLGMPSKLVDCVILDNQNWRCAYPSGEGYLTVVNGLEGIPENTQSFSFSLRRYQYWYVTVYWLIFGEAPRGEWLIPEQEIAFPE